MRVISGTYKGHSLKPVPNRLTRPTTDKVKEALFQTVGPFFEGGQCLDLFAGSGGLGLEALSRGIDKTVFVDKHPKAIQTINENIKALHLEERCEVFRTEAFRALKAASKRGLVFSIIMLDPPYGKFSYEDLIEKIYTYQLLETQGFIVCEHETHTTLIDQHESIVKIKSEIYGTTSGITLYQNKG